MKLLRIDSSARRESVSRQLTSEFTALWKRENRGGVVMERDLSRESFSPITDDWVSATHVPPTSGQTLRRRPWCAPISSLLN
jgi:FMN-dependent NADH-azoreductase